MKRYKTQWPNPNDRMMAKMLIVGFGGAGSGMAALLWVAGDIDFAKAALSVLLLVLTMLFVAVMVALVRVREVAILRVDALVIEHPCARVKYDWRDVVSVSLKRPSYANRLDRCLAAVFLGSDKDRPCVHIILRRDVRASLWPFAWKEASGTRVRGLPLPGQRVVREYLDDVEGFVREAQQFLTKPET